MLVNIAIVYDKASNRSIIKDKLLRHKIFEVSLTAENGKDFLDKMKILPLDKLPSVVLMDLEMPEMDGGVRRLQVGHPLPLTYIAVSIPLD